MKTPFTIKMGPSVGKCGSLIDSSHTARLMSGGSVSLRLSAAEYPLTPGKVGEPPPGAEYGWSTSAC